MADRYVSREKVQYDHRKILSISNLEIKITPKVKRCATEKNAPKAFTSSAMQMPSTQHDAKMLLRSVYDFAFEAHRARWLKKPFAVAQGRVNTNALCDFRYSMFFPLFLN